MADPAAVEDDAVAQQCPLTALDELADGEFDLTGSVSLGPPQRRTSRPKWVSTVMPGMSKALPRITLAVLRPIPGRLTTVHRGRYLTVEPIDECLAKADQRVGLVAVEAGWSDQFLEFGRLAPA